MVNYKKSQNFWENRGVDVVRGKISNLSSVMLTPEDKISEYRDKIEKKIFLQKIKLKKNYSVLDLGCGTGRWVFFLAPLVKKVEAFDFSNSFIKTAKQSAMRLKITNVSFKVANLLEYRTNNKFDLIYAGGVFQYINDEDLNRLISYLKTKLKKNGMFISRDSVNLKKRYVVTGKYETIYRSENELISIFTKNNFILVDSFDNLPPLVFYKIYKLLPYCLRKKFVLDMFMNMSERLDSLLRILSPMFYFVAYWMLKLTFKFDTRKFYFRHKFYIFKKDGNEKK